MQQAARVSDQRAFFLASMGQPGVIVEHGDTEAMFQRRGTPGPTTTSTAASADLHVEHMLACEGHASYPRSMSMIQIRNVPEDVHRRLKARAALEGVSLSDMALAELRRSLDRPTRRELLDLVASREPVVDGPSSADLVDSARRAS